MDGDATVTNPQPTPQPDPSMVQVSRAEWEAWNSAKPLYEAANKYGFKDTGEFDRFGPMLTAVREQGYDPSLLAAALRGRAGERDDADAPQTSPEIEVMRKHIEADAREAYQNMDRAEKAAINAQAKALANEWFGNEDEFSVAVVKKALMYDAAYARQEYGQDHVLHGSVKYRPVDPDGVSGLRKPYDELRAKSKGLSQAALADAAAKKTPVSPVAGRSGGQGAPDAKTESKQTVPFRMRSAEDKRAAAEALAKRSPQTRRVATV